MSLKTDASAALRIQIREYVDANAQSVPTTQKERLYTDAEKKAKDLVRTYVQEAKEHARSKKEREFCTKFTSKKALVVHKSAIPIITAVFQADYDVEATFEEGHRVEITDWKKPGLEEALLGPLFNRNRDIYNYAWTHRHKVTLTFFNNNPHIYGRSLNEKSKQSAKAHLKREWDALKSGRGVDLEISEKGAIGATLKAHKAKLLMHSETLFKERSGSFKEASEKWDTLELDPAICTLKTFELLLEIIYLGELADGRKIDLKELQKLYMAADYYHVEVVHSFCVDYLRSLLDDKKVTGEELCTFFGHAVTTMNKELISLCFDHFSINPLMHNALVTTTTDKNWQALFELAKDNPDVQEVLVAMTATNRDLLQFKPSHPPAASSAASSSSVSSSTEPLSLEEVD